MCVLIRMKIIEIIPSRRRDDITRYALSIACGFSREGDTAVAYTRDITAVDTLFRQNNIPLFHAPISGYFDIPSALILARDLRSEPQDTVVHVHRYRDAFMALLARKIAGRKDIKVIHTRHKVRRGVDTWLLRRVYRNLDAQIFVSQMARDRFLSHWTSEYPFDPQKLHVVFPTLDRDPEKPLDEPHRGAVTALYIGDLAPGKGLEILIDALYRLREARGRVRICGTGNPDYVDSLRRRAQARGVMEMIDWKKDTPDPSLLLEGCHFGVIPSVSPEAFATSSLFFLASGRPVVATNNGAQTEYLRNGENSLLVPPANAASLGEALLKMASDSTLRANLAQGAFDTHRRLLTWKQAFSTLKRLFS